LPAIEISRFKHGDGKTARGVSHSDRARLRWEPPPAA
jgi:hypothetical protein